MKLYGLEELNPDELDKAIKGWRDEDDGSADYPTLGEVLATQFGYKPFKKSTLTKLRRAVIYFARQPYGVRVSKKMQAVLDECTEVEGDPK